MLSFAILFITCLLSVQSVPIETQNNEIPLKNNEAYDLSKFDEVHDQRQNGTENWRVNLNKVMLVWVPPKDLLTAAMLLSPDVLGGSDFSDLEELLKPEKPEEAMVIKPETTTKGSDLSTSSDSSTTVGVSNGPASSRRRLRVPGFLRPFVRRQHTQQ